MGGKRADKRRMNELRVDVAVKENFNLRNLKWASHVERRGDNKCTKRAYAQKVERKKGGKED